MLNCNLRAAIFSTFTRFEPFKLGPFFQSCSNFLSKDAGPFPGFFLVFHTIVIQWYTALIPVKKSGQGTHGTVINIPAVDTLDIARHLKLIKYFYSFMR